MPESQGLAVEVHDGDEETRLLSAYKLSYERAVDTAASAKLIASPDLPIFPIGQDVSGQPVQGRVPTWKEINPSQEEIERIKKLKDPIAVVSIPGISLETKAQLLSALKIQTKWGDKDLGLEATDDLVSWEPDNRRNNLGRPIKNRLKTNHYTSNGVDILFMDGVEEAPNRFVRDAFEMFDLCKMEGFIQPDIHAYIALQLEGKRRGKGFDKSRPSLLDGYITSSRSVVMGKWNEPDDSLELLQRAPTMHCHEITMPVFSGRRAVRISKKI